MERQDQSKEPFSRATKTLRVKSEFRVTNGNIAAIDFGTTSVSLAYTTQGNKLINTIKIDQDTFGYRVPNAILLKVDSDDSCRVEGFGKNAQTRYMQIRRGEHIHYIYFERIKMILKRDKTINRQTLIESFFGNKYYVVEVIAFILKHLRDLLIDHLSRTWKPLKTTDFDWVITVPAIWDARGKRMMREAAYLAGLLTDSPGITQFTQVGLVLSIPIELNLDRLSLALEPEVAAIYSQHVTTTELALAQRTYSAASRYVVIDIGGGTVDITAHVQSNQTIEVISVPTGNAWGGTKVNELFSTILQQIVCDPNFEQFISSDDYSRRMTIINKLIYQEFEEQKLSFGNCQTNDIIIDLPNKLLEHYGEKKFEEGVKLFKGVEFCDDSLCCCFDFVNDNLFGPAMDGIIQCSLDTLKAINYDIDTAYLVGGFGGCKYVYQKVESAIVEVFEARNSSCRIIVPTAPSLAVVQGAAMWRKNPDIVKERRADATYGIGVSIPFKKDVHDRYYYFFNDEHKEDKCASVFCVFLQKGESIKADEILTTSMTPLNQSDKEINITIYTTLQLGVQYIRDKQGEPTVTKIGQLKIDIPNPGNVPRTQRIVDIAMDFSGTEIQAKAKYRVTNEEVKIVCDFLSLA